MHNAHAHAFINMYIDNAGIMLKLVDANILWESNFLTEYSFSEPIFFTYKKYLLPINKELKLSAKCFIFIK